MMMRFCKSECCYAHWLNGMIQLESVCGYPLLSFGCFSCFYNPLNWKKKKSQKKPLKQKKQNNCLK